jgi:hypothetical protein
MPDWMAEFLQDSINRPGPKPFLWKTILWVLFTALAAVWLLRRWARTRALKGEMPLSPLGRPWIAIRWIAGRVGAAKLEKEMLRVEQENKKNLSDTEAWELVTRYPKGRGSPGLQTMLFLVGVAIVVGLFACATR